MRASVRLLFPAVLAAAAACGGEANAPDAWPTRAQLTGVYGCAEARVFYARPVPPTNEIREAWRLGSCTQYMELTNPSREFEMDTTLFFITSDDRIRRVREFPSGDITYDERTGTLLAAYPTGDTVTYQAVADLSLQQMFAPADYTGDGRVDSVQLKFIKVE
jgi:hypothetical protein